MLALRAFVGLLALLVASSAGARDLLDRNTLLSGKYRQPVDLSASAPTPDAQPATQHFEGRLRLRGQAATRTLLALDDFLGRGDIAQARTLPQDFELAFVQDGGTLIPAKRGPQPSEHPWWEFAVEPGRVWNEPGDGGYSRAAIPFALVQRNANCTHNGVLMLLFRSDGAVSQAAMQVSSETCHYLQLDMW